MAKTYQRHALSAAYSDLKGEDFDALVASIQKKNGLERKIVLFEGKVLDGWQRHRACIIGKVSPTYEDYRGDDPAQFVRNMNNHRRHESAAERAIAAAVVNGWRSAGRQANGPNGPVNEKSSKELAVEAGVGVTSIKDAKSIVEHGAAVTQRAALDGDISLRAAADIARTTPKSEQAAAVKEAKEGPKEPKRKAAKKSATPKPPKPPTVLKTEYDKLVNEHAEALKEYVGLQQNRDELSESLLAVENLQDDKSVLVEKQLRVEIRELKRARDEGMAEVRELTTQCAYWKKEAQKLGWKPPIAGKKKAK